MMYLYSYLSVDKVCKSSGFDAGEVRTYQSNGLNIEQVTCINFEGQCSGNIDSQEMGMRENYYDNQDYDYSFDNSYDENMIAITIHQRNLCTTTIKKKDRENSSIIVIITIMTTIIMKNQEKKNQNYNAQ